MTKKLRITLYFISAYLTLFGVLFLLAPSVAERITHTTHDATLNVLYGQYTMTFAFVAFMAARKREATSELSLVVLVLAAGHVIVFSYLFMSGITPCPPTCIPRGSSAGMSHSEALCRLTVGDRRKDMIRWALRRAIDKVGRNLNTDVSYVRDMIDASPRAVWLFFRAAALGKFRRDVPIEAWFAAGLTAMRHEDCDPCTQLGVTMAERDGVSPAVLRAVLTDNPDAMPPDVALAWKFTRATLAHDAEADKYREAIVQRWGRRALVSLAFAITSARLYPTVKYALGHSKACTRVVVGGTPVLFDRGRVPRPADARARTA
jgi:hypothetical protein